MSDTANEPAAPVRERMQRTFTLTVEDTRAVGNGSGAITACLSSEAPVERYDARTGTLYWEVLDHGPGSVDLKYARETMPFCLDHDTGRQIGSVTNLTIRNRRLYGDIIPGNHPDAGWVFDDIRAGIRTKVSIGYQQGTDVEHVKPKNGERIGVRRFKGWTLLEASSVAIPANTDVGFGRDQSAAPHPTTSAPQAGASSQRNAMDTTQNTSTREAELASIASMAKLEHRLPGWIFNGTSVEHARAEALSVMAANMPVPMNATNPNPLGANIAARAHAAPKDSPLFAAFTSPESAVARDTTSQLTREMGFAPRTGGNFMPLDVAALNRPSHSRVLTTTGSTTGAELVPAMQMSFADRLREDMLAAEVGVRFIAISGGTAAFPVATADPTVVELAENPGSGAGLSDPAFASRTAAPKCALVRVALSNHIALASNPEAVGTTATIMGRALADHMDGRIFAGPTGGNGPVGAFYATGTSTYALGAAGAAISYVGLVGCEKALVDAKGEADDVVVLTTSAVRSELQQTQDFPTASAGRPLWADGRVMGRPAYSRSWMPSTLTKSTGSNLHGLLMYSPRRAGHLVVTWPAVEITVDRLTGADKQLTYITAALYYDVVLLHPGAVVRIADIDVS